MMLNLQALQRYAGLFYMVEGDGFEPSKAVPADLQSDPFGHSGTPPGFLYLINVFPTH